jgi:HemY protein
VKRFLLFVVIFSLLGGCFAYLLENKTSYVLLAYESYAFESSLWFFIIAVIIFYFIVNFALAILLKLYRPGQRFNAWAFTRRVEASKREFYQAILDFEVGDWDKALKKFKSSAKSLDRPIVAYLYAARSAQKLGRRDICEEMLHEAALSEPKSSLAVGIVRAELLLEENDMSEAANVLNELKIAAPSNHQVQSLIKSLPSSA